MLTTAYAHSHYSHCCSAAFQMTSGDEVHEAEMCAISSPHSRRTLLKKPGTLAKA